MKLNRKWINEEFVDLHEVSDKEFVETLTVFGQKVETWERMDAEIKNVVVGKVVSIVRHPNSDHMFICQVDVGQAEPVQIVTGAQNVHEGDLVPAALHNSYLPGGVHITKGKLRGEVSNGMLCSFAELGLTQNDLPGVFADGIWILDPDAGKPGDDINKIIGNDDTVVDFEITNNRPDCYSIIGLARETAAAFGKHMRHHEPVVHGSDAGSIFDHLDVEVEAENLCNRYTSRMVANVKIAPSPKWLRRRLRANGVRPINNIVDITNYVMLEYGQPMHAFDFSCIDGKQIIEDFVYVVRKHHVLRQQREDPFCGCGVLGQLLDADLVGGVADDPCGQSVACGCVKQLIRDFDFRAGYCRFGKQVGRCYFRCQFYHSLTLFDVQPLYSIFAMRQAAEISTVCTNPCRFFRRNRTKSLRSCPESRFVFRQAALQRGKAFHLSC